MAERGYGWEKLISEMFCQEYWAERGLETHIARFHNIYGPHGTWFGGREKAPAALSRKVIEASTAAKPPSTSGATARKPAASASSTIACSASTRSCTATG
jgi:nucleoside-diphosphate-sugar epimerase